MRRTPRRGAYRRAPRLWRMAPALLASQAGRAGGRLAAAFACGSLCSVLPNVIQCTQRAPARPRLAKSLPR